MRRKKRCVCVCVCVCFLTHGLQWMMCRRPRPRLSGACSVLCRPCAVSIRTYRSCARCDHHHHQQQQHRWPDLTSATTAATMTTMTELYSLSQQRLRQKLQLIQLGGRAVPHIRAHMLHPHPRLDYRVRACSGQSALQLPVSNLRYIRRLSYSRRTTTTRKYTRGD